MSRVIEWTGLPSDINNKLRINTVLESVLSSPEKSIEKTKSRCETRVVTQSVHNNMEFGDATKRLDTMEAFTKLHNEQNTKGESAK